MRKSFEEVLALTADEFAVYFNSQVARALGQGGAAASLTEDEQDRIKEIRLNLYEKLKKPRARRLMVSLEEIYQLLESGYIDEATLTLQGGLNAAASGVGGGGAAAAAAPAVSETPSLASLSEGPLRGIASYLPPQGQGRLATASKALHTDLKKDLQLSKFLVHVARGQQDEAEAMLRTDSKLLTRSGKFTDYSGRSFNCTAYEYAYWAKDTHMCRMLETHMDEDAKALLRERIDTMESFDPATRQARGLVYWQNGVKHHSAHFDLTPLITALQEYVNGFDAWYTASNWAAIQTAWLKVGLAQRDVPGHVAQEYCRPDRSFLPTPSFTEATLPRVLSFYNYGTRRSDSWFPIVSPSSGLGFDFAVARVERAPWGHAGGWLGAGARCDLAAIRRLDEVRTADLTLSRDRLNPPATAPGLRS